MAKKCAVIVSLAVFCVFDSSHSESRAKDPVAAYDAFLKAEAGGDLAAALDSSRRAYKLAEEVWGGKDRRTAVFATSYADEICRRPDFDTARQLYSRCSQVLSELGEQSSLERTYCLGREADVLIALGRMTEAAEPLEKVVLALTPYRENNDATVLGQLGGAHLTLAALRSPRLAAIMARAAPEWRSDKIQRGDASVHAAKAAELLKSAFGPRHEMTGMAILAQGFSAEDEEAWRVAARYFQEGADIFKERFGALHPLTRRAELFAKLAEVTAVLTEMPGDSSKIGADGRAAREGCSFWPRDGVDIEVCPIVRMPPIYPPSAKSMWSEGFAVVTYDVSVAGATENLSIRDSWPKSLFDQAALDAVKDWTFEPPTAPDGTPVRVDRLDTLVRFELTD